MERRLQFFSLTFVFLFLLLVARLFYWQVLKGDELSSQAKMQYKDGFTLSAARGDILAKDGSSLAANITGWLLYASLEDIEENPKIIAEKLSSLFISKEEDEELEVYEERLEKEQDRLFGLLTRDDVVWVPLKQRLEKIDKQKIEKLGFRGLGFEEMQMRYYPESSSSAQLLGFVGKDEDGADKGYFGLEGYYDLSLSGKDGYMLRESDAGGVPILFGSSREVSAIGGVDLITNIEKRIQLSIEKKLAKGIEKYGAKAGTVIVMDPKTGGVMGMASYPSYDPRQYWEYGDEFFKNPAISFSFEPGSIFKVLVMAAGLDAGVIDPDTKCDICDGPYKVDKYFIKTWNGKYYPDSSMTDVIVHSDNVGMTFVANKLGVDKMYEYLQKFGIGDVTDIDLQGEFSPALRQRQKWSNVDLATASFGQGIAVTPIQMMRSVSIIANKGLPISPQVVDKIVAEDKTYDIDPELGERIISQEVSEKITAMMVEAAAKGEAKWTYQKGFGVAGKTGTAQIPIEGHYDEEKTIASFIGFAPYDDPKFLMLVTLRESESSPWASETAAPLWYDIANELFLFLGIQPKK